jgi:hypothetical protein
MMVEESGGNQKSNTPDSLMAGAKDGSFMPTVRLLLVSFLEAALKPSIRQVPLVKVLNMHDLCS